MNMIKTKCAAYACVNETAYGDRYFCSSCRFRWRTYCFRFFGNSIPPLNDILLALNLFSEKDI